MCEASRCGKVRIRWCDFSSRSEEVSPHYHAEKHWKSSGKDLKKRKKKKVFIICVYCLFEMPFSELNLQDLSHLLDKVFLIFPNYCLGMSVSQFYQNYEFIKFCTSSPLTEIICQVWSKYCPSAA